MTESSSLRGLTCVVIGAGGFLGAHLCPRLKERGAEVRGYGRTAYYGEPLSGITWIRGLMSDLNGLASIVEGADVVFHLAGSSTPASAEAARLKDLESNVLGSVSLLDICRNARVPRVIFASSGGTVYGVADNPPFTEMTLPKPASAYGINKLTVEHYLRLYNHLYGMRNLSLRISNPYGPYQHGLKNQGVISIFARQALLGQDIKIWGDGSIVRDYIYAVDVGEALAASVIYAGKFPILNIGSGIGRSLTDVVRSLELVLGRSIRRTHLPARAFDVPVSVLDCSLAKQELQWEPTSDWITGLQKTCEWAKRCLGSASSSSK